MIFLFLLSQRRSWNIESRIPGSFFLNEAESAIKVAAQRLFPNEGSALEELGGGLPSPLPTLKEIRTVVKESENPAWLGGEARTEFPAFGEEPVIHQGFARPRPLKELIKALRTMNPEAVNGAILELGVVKNVFKVKYAAMSSGDRASVAVALVEVFKQEMSHPHHPILKHNCEKLEFCTPKIALDLLADLARDQTARKALKSANAHSTLNKYKEFCGQALQFLIRSVMTAILSE